MSTKLSTIWKWWHRKKQPRKFCYIFITFKIYMVKFLLSGGWGQVRKPEGKNDRGQPSWRFTSSNAVDQRKFFISYKTLTTPVANIVLSAKYIVRKLCLINELIIHIKMKRFLNNVRIKLSKYGLKSTVKNVYWAIIIK